ncbi:MAG: chromate transporter [Nitrospirae bacterium]|nr:chromate transporter [Nitrospirota bacterium]
MSLLTFCWILFYISSLTIGGGYAMLPLLQREFVDKHHWLTNQEFLDAIAIGQLSPGPLTVMNAFIGFKLHGVAGSLLAVICSYLPSLVIVTLAVKYYYAYKNSAFIASSFTGVKSAVIGLLAAVALSLGATSLVDPETFAIALCSFALITFTKIDPSFIILGAGLIGAFIF